MTDSEQKDQAMAEAEAPKEEVKPEEDAPAAKKQRTEEPAEAAAAADTAPGEAVAAAAGEGEGAAAAKAQEACAPQKIGYRTFQTGSECYKYYQNLVAKLRKHQNLNEYEFHMVEDLVRRGHPEAARKLGGGLQAVQVRETDVHGARTSCFFLIHKDGVAEDVSYRKCIAKLFPDMSDLTAHYGSSQQKARAPGGGRGRGRGGGRGRGRGRR